MTQWHEMDRSERIRSLADMIGSQRMSASQAASRIPGATRNAVIGLARRAGIKLVPKPVAQPKSASEPKPRPYTPPTPRPEKAMTNDRRFSGTPLDDIPANGCKWPINDGGPFLFCAEPRADGRPYCAFHARLSVGMGSKSERDADRQLRRLLR